MDTSKTTVLKPAPILGVIRLDYDYPPLPGDIDHPDSYNYKVLFRVVPGFTFAMAKKGKLTPAVEKEFIDALKWFEEKNASCITGDCGFMLWFQKYARQNISVPVIMSSLCQLPTIACSLSTEEDIIILTASEKDLDVMRDLIRSECSADIGDDRFNIVGAGSVPGFEAVNLGNKVDFDLVQPGIVELAKNALKEFPKSRAFCLECTELPAYADAIRAATGLPVFDAITACDFFINSKRDNNRFGNNGWQKKWDGKQEDYTYGSNLTEEQKGKLVNKCSDSL